MRKFYSQEKILFILEVILPLIISIFFTFFIFSRKITVSEEFLDANALSVICTVVITIVITSFTSFCSSASKAAVKISNHSNKVSYFILSTLSTVGINIITVVLLVFKVSEKIKVVFFIYSISFFWNYIMIIGSAFYYDLKELSKEEKRKEEILERLDRNIMKITEDIIKIKNKEK